MGGDDTADLPVADNGPQRRIEVAPKLPSATNWELICNVAGEDVCLIVEAWTPIGTWIVDILPAGLATRARRVRAAPPRPKVAGRIAQTL